MPNIRCQRLLQRLRDYKKPVVGIGVTAFLRTGPISLLPNYEILCLKETADVFSIKEKCKVISVEKDLGGERPEKDNTSSILILPSVQKYLKTINCGSCRSPAPLRTPAAGLPGSRHPQFDVGFFVYKSSVATERIVEGLGGRVLGNKAKIRNPFEDKRQFRILAKEAGLPILPGETTLIDVLDKQKFLYHRRILGEKLVFQLTDYKVGGGIGTVFINDNKDFEDFLGFVQRRRKKEKDLKWVNVTPFVEGIAASIIGMVTRHGILAGPLQMQFIDVAEVTAFHGRNGVFCGHDWESGRFNLTLQRQAENLVQVWGKFMAKKGYRGIFGVDVVVDEKNGRVCPIECNARYTAAFPTYSMLQLADGEPSFDVFQLLEFLEIPYDLDIEKLQKSYRESKVGAQLILHNQTRRWIKIGGSLPAGVYKVLGGELKWLREGFAIQDIKEPGGEFILTDGASEKGRILKPGERMGRILFKRSIAEDSNKINDWAREIVGKVYEGFAIEILKKRE